MNWLSFRLNRQEEKLAGACAPAGKSQNLKLIGSNTLTVGTKDLGVDEPPSPNYRQLTTISLEFAEISEGKWLSPANLKSLIGIFGSVSAAGAAAGVSEAFVRQTIKRS